MNSRTSLSLFILIGGLFFWSIGCYSTSGSLEPPLTQVPSATNSPPAVDRTPTEKPVTPYQLTLQAGQTQNAVADQTRTVAGTQAAAHKQTVEAFTSTSSPTFDPALLPTSPLFAYYPLTPGFTRVYSLTISELEWNDDNSELIEVKWTGVMTETVTTFSPTSDGLRVTSAISGRPDEIDDWTCDISGDVLTECTNVEGFYLPWPFEVGKSWDLSGIAVMNVWKIDEQTEIQTAAGQFSDCFHFTQSSNSHYAEFYLCDGVGIVALILSHAGWGRYETWEILAVKRHP